MNLLCNLHSHKTLVHVVYLSILQLHYPESVHTEKEKECGNQTQSLSTILWQPHPLHFWVIFKLLWVSKFFERNTAPNQSNCTSVIDSHPAQSANQTLQRAPNVAHIPAERVKLWVGPGQHWCLVALVTNREHRNILSCLYW